MNLDVQLAQLEETQILRRLVEPDLAYVFKHALTQETAYSSLTLKTRRSLHLRVARCYEQLFADQLDQYAPLLAQHYAEAGDDAQTLKYATRAGDAAGRVYANAEAIAFYSLALAAAQRIPTPSEQLVHLFLRRGRAFELSAQFDRARRNYEEMEALARERDDRKLRLEALIALATVLSIPASEHDPEQAQILSQEALQLARELGDRPAEAKILWNLLLRGIYSGADPQQGIEYGEQSIAIARELNLREQLAFSLHDMFVALLYAGQVEKALQVREEAATLWRELDNRPMLSENRSGLAVLYVLRGELDRARALAEEGFRLSESIGNLNGQGFAGHLLSFIHLERGEPDRAIQWLEDPLRLSQQRGLQGPGLDPHAELGWIHANLGDYEKARAWISLGLEHARAQIAQEPSWLRAVSARIELLAGDVEHAAQQLAQGNISPSVETYGFIFPLAAPAVYFAPAELAVAQGDYGRVLALMDEFAQELRRRGYAFFLPEVLHLKAKALLGRGETDTALEILQEARTSAESFNARRNVWMILTTMSELESQRGKAAEAARLRERAREIIEYIANRAPSPELRDKFLNQPRVRALTEPVPQPQ